MTEASSGGEDEWADVEPIPQDDGPRPAVAIAYSRDFSHAMGLLRAALQRNELSHRSLRLTERVIAMNAANYTAWHFRRLCVQSLGASLDAELDWLDDMAELHAKNYQVWHHRRWVVEKLGAAIAPRELRFSEDTLRQGDSKNYHLWSHRIWVLQNLGGATWQQELDFCDRLLADDPWNNSAWNQRMFALSTLLDGAVSPHALEPMPRTSTCNVPAQAPACMSTLERDQVYRAELGYALASIRATPANECPWIYLAGLGRLAGRGLQGEELVMELCAVLIANSEEAQLQSEAGKTEEHQGGPCVAQGQTSWMTRAERDTVLRHVHAFLLDLLGDGAEAAQINAVLRGHRATAMDAHEVGTWLCNRLQQEDKMRAKFWEMRNGLS